MKVASLAARLALIVAGALGFYSVRALDLGHPGFAGTALGFAIVFALAAVLDAA